MPNYNFSTAFSIQPLRFQQFACAVLSKREQCTFQRFGAGKDGGIDGIFCCEDKKIIIQAKCTGSRGRALINILKREAQKAKKLDCSRYILVLSTDTVEYKEKEKIRELFPRILSTQDIVTGQDINGLLELPQYADIEREYSELWLCSGNQLEKMLSETVLNRIKAESDTKFKLMAKVSDIFVSTAAFSKMIDILEKKHKIIISGVPGIGKTTHALCVGNYYITMLDYKELYFVNSIQQIEQILGLSKNEKTIIIFDDFWGYDSFKEYRVELNFERKMGELFEVLEYYPNVRLIFTTREFVLQQGYARFPEMEKICESEKITIELDTYSMEEKAEILYRHIDRAQLEYRYIESIFKISTDIIECSAYSPRSIDYFLGNTHAEEYEETEYAKALYEFVKYPEKRYEEMFRELSYGAKWICVLILLSDGPIRINEELKEAFIQISEVMPDKIEKLDYENYLRELEGEFTEISSSIDNELVAEFLNYSIRDFFRNYMKQHKEFFENVFVNKAIYFNHLYYMVDQMGISDKNSKIAIKRLLDEMDEMKFTYVDSFDVDINYNVNSLPESYHAHKVWLMLLLYKKTGDNDIYVFLTQYYNDICERLHVENVTSEIMYGAVNIIPSMWKMGFHLDWENFLEDYYKNISWYNDLRYLNIFKKYCGNIYDIFLEKHYEDIRENIYRLVYEDIEYFLDEPDGEAEIEDILMSVEDTFKEYNLPYSKSLEKSLYNAAEREIPKKGTYRHNMRKTSHYSGREMPSEVFTQKMREWLLPDVKYLPPKQIKQIERDNGRDYRSFLYTLKSKGN